MQAIAPPLHTATASTSTLCKVLTWHLSGLLSQSVSGTTPSEGAVQPVVLHQADWLASLLHEDRQGPWHTICDRHAPL